MYFKNIPILYTALWLFFVIGVMDQYYPAINDMLTYVSLPEGRRPEHELARRNTDTVSTTTFTTEIPCSNDKDCNNGACVALNSTSNYCSCTLGWKSLDTSGLPSDKPCDYKQLTSLAGLLISIFLGHVHFCD
jgi:hypothetical protein